MNFTSILNFTVLILNSIYYHIKFHLGNDCYIFTNQNSYFLYLFLFVLYKCYIDVIPSQCIKE